MWSEGRKRVSSSAGGGRMIKRIGVDARTDLENLLGVQVHLETTVKVLRNWRSNEEFHATGRLHLAQRQKGVKPADR